LLLAKIHPFSKTEGLLFALKDKFGEIDPNVEAQIQKLASPQLEDLSEALLDFELLEDLTAWLSHLSSSN
jgi:hypothetical protein